MPPMRPPPSRAGAAAAVAGLVALVGGQAMWVRRRYGARAPAVSAVDVTVLPAGQERGVLPPVEMAAFGDSGMAGVGVAAVADTLPVQLAQLLADRSGRRVHVVGYARSGSRTADVLAEQVPLALRGALARHGVDVSVLLVGTNDVTHVSPPRALARSCGDLLDALLALGGPVVVCSLPEFRAMRALPHPLVDAAAGYAGVVRGVQRRAVRERPAVHLVDARGAVGHEFVRDTATMSGDSFHPSATGYRRIAETMAPAVERALAAGRSRTRTAEPAADQAGPRPLPRQGPAVHSDSRGRVSSRCRTDERPTSECRTDERM